MEEGKGSFGQAVGFTTIQYSDENILDSSTLKNSTEYINLSNIVDITCNLKRKVRHNCTGP